ncbi:hypothetical protein D3C81_1790350 [compost metagenome]
MQVVHRNIPGNQSGAEVHCNHDAAVPDLPAPHFFFGEEVPQKSRSANRQESADHGPVDRHYSRMAESADPQHLEIVVKMNLPRIKLDIPRRA